MYLFVYLHREDPLLILILLPCPAHWEGTQSDGTVVSVLPSFGPCSAFTGSGAVAVRLTHPLLLCPVESTAILTVEFPVTTSGERMFMTDIMNDHNSLNKLKSQHMSWISLITLTYLEQ